MRITITGKTCLRCARPLKEGTVGNICEIHQIIDAYNSKKIRKYPTDSVFLFDSLRYKQVAKNMNAKGLAYYEKGFCYIGIATIKKECPNTTEGDFLRHLMRTITHELIHLVLFQQEGYLTSFRYDHIWMKIKMNGYEGIKMHYNKEILHRIHVDYIKRSRALLEKI